MKNKKVITYAILLLGIFFILYGSYRGEIDTVFTKAIRLCLECVGIG